MCWVSAAWPKDRSLGAAASRGIHRGLRRLLGSRLGQSLETGRLLALSTLKFLQQLVEGRVPFLRSFDFLAVQVPQRLDLVLPGFQQLGLLLGVRPLGLGEVRPTVRRI